jgi:hypothetical protein
VSASASGALDDCSQSSSSPPLPLASPSTCRVISDCHFRKTAAEYDSKTWHKKRRLNMIGNLV